MQTTRSPIKSVKLITVPYLILQQISHAGRLLVCQIRTLILTRQPQTSSVLYRARLRQPNKNNSLLALLDPSHTRNQHKHTSHVTGKGGYSSGVCFFARSAHKSLRISKTSAYNFTSHINCLQ